MRILREIERGGHRDLIETIDVQQQVELATLDQHQDQLNHLLRLVVTRHTESNELDLATLHFGQLGQVFDQRLGVSGPATEPPIRPTRTTSSRRWRTIGRSSRNPSTEIGTAIGSSPGPRGVYT